MAPVRSLRLPGGEWLGRTLALDIHLSLEWGLEEGKEEELQRGGRDAL